MEINVRYNISHGFYKNPITWDSPYGWTRVIDGQPKPSSQEEFREESRKIKKAFRADLLKQYGVESHPKAERCFALAWEHGHASGLEEVMGYFEEFVELLLP